MKQKLLITTLLYSSILAVLVFGFQNCSSSSRFSQQAEVSQNSESPTVTDTNVVDNNIPSVDLTNAKLTLRGTLRSLWRSKAAISKDPIAGVTLHVKIGARFDAATKNKPDFKTLTTDATGFFEFKDLPNNTYTIYWDVPAHYYHENDYAQEFKVTQLNEVRDVSDAFTIHQHGVAYTCWYSDNFPMKNLTARLYESISPRSTTKANTIVRATATTAEDGSFYMDTAHLPTGSGGGVVELSDSNGNVVGRVALDQLNHLALIGGGYCE